MKSTSLSSSWLGYGVLKDSVRSNWRSGDMSPLRILQSSAAASTTAETATVTMAAMAALAGKADDAKLLVHALKELNVATSWPVSGHAREGTSPGSYTAACCTVLT